MSDDGKVHEIVIIKRHGGGHEEGHHGGAWKIAYADFVTAMMAFFLVMWLVSANDKTKASIARYFNPVLLVDSTPQPPGLTDPRPGAPTPKMSSKPDSPAKHPETKVSEPKQEKPPPRRRTRRRLPARPRRRRRATSSGIPMRSWPTSRQRKTRNPRSQPSKASENLKGGAGKGLTDGNKGAAPPRVRPATRAGRRSATRSNRWRPARRACPKAACRRPRSLSRPIPRLRPALTAEEVADAAPLPADPEAKAAELRNRIATLMKSVHAGSARDPPQGRRQGHAGGHSGGPDRRCEVRDVRERLGRALAQDRPADGEDRQAAEGTERPDRGPRLYR